uniref:NADH dehydrogenase [ubiquinone] 1 beta subcomplex subunit 4 n=1 Tax=Anoplophora glabripennis TaxID=217634 RepID=V5GYY5_ANOGL
MSQQFDIDNESRKIIEEKAKRRATLREQFLKLKTDPFQHASGEGGTVFDPAMQRYTAMKVSGFEYFKPSGKNVLYGLLFMVIPMVGFGYLVKKTRMDEEDRIRRGDVAYKDRNFKFI